MSEATIMLLEDDEAAGKLLMVHVNGKFYTWKPPGFRKSLVPVEAAAAPAGAHLCDATFTQKCCAPVVKVISSLPAWRAS